MYEINEKCKVCDGTVMERIFYKGWEWHKCKKCGHEHKAYDFSEEGESRAE